jgi:hypothetical protein
MVMESRLSGKRLFQYWPLIEPPFQFPLVDTFRILIGTYILFRSAIVERLSDAFYL